MLRYFSILIVLIFSSVHAFTQYKMSISANYNIPQSADFQSAFKNGWGGSGEIYYFFEETGFSASLLFGLNAYRGTHEKEQSLRNSNTTIIDYKYKVNYYNFPLILSANYTLFYDNKFNIIFGYGFGGIFMEYKEKQIGRFTSSTRNNTFNEFAIYPSLAVSYEFINDVSFLLKGGYSITLGKKKIRYIDINAGIIYKI